MRISRLLTMLAFLIASFGLAVVAFPSSSFGQTDKPEQEKRAEAQDDDDDDEELTDADRREVKVSLEAARQIALEKVAGRVMDEELEKERGRLQYAFDIKTPEGKIYDVEISAVTGEVFQAQEDDDEAAASAKQKPKKAKAARTAKLTKPKTP